MLFNSIEYAIFLPLVFLVYWGIQNRSLRWQNVFVLGVSYLFYGWWDWRFLTLIIFSSLVDFSVGYFLGRPYGPRTRKILLLISLCANLGILAYFKYANFFITEFVALMTSFGMSVSPITLQLILPVGISFYTFQTLSYTIDIYRGKVTPTTNLIAMLAFVSFFPQLVAGPIERASDLLPQFLRKRRFEYTAAVSGMQQILWGLFKKVVVADNAAAIVNRIFAGDFAESNSVILVLGLVLFAVQIYGDFSGYSDMAIGSARLLGFNLSQNFAYPYFSRSVAEFWRRWHISLTGWFRDYVYIPLGGSRGGRGEQIRNTLVVFLVSGFWHGASWNFVVWGGINALFFLPLIVGKRNRRFLDTAGGNRRWPSLRETAHMVGTFLLICFTWLFFRSPDMVTAWGYLLALITNVSVEITLTQLGTMLAPQHTFLWIILLFAFEWLNRHELFGLRIRFSRLLNWLIYLILLVIIFFFGVTNNVEFIYFQF
jgi:D-alanyl-lipoteichoic acid acyltransferase DltB (MBOAT superfamily)